MHQSAVSAAAVLPESAPDSQRDGGSDAALWGIIFAGGIGSRFWPLSSPKRPKQLLALVDNRPLISDTIRRFAPLIPPERMIVVTSRDIAGAIHAVIPEVPERNMIVEPFPLGTTASLAWAAAAIRKRAGSDALVCATHADLAISFIDLFHAAVTAASSIAQRHDRIVLLGVPSTRPEEGFGYIVAGDPVQSADFESRGALRANKVQRFLEKPGASTATELVRLGALWHSGMFIASTKRIEEELRENVPEVAEAIPYASDTTREEFMRLSASIPLEKALFERSRSLAVVRAECAWDDVGTWASLRRARDLDDEGNGVMGDAHLVDSSANVVHTGDGATVLYGVNNLLVVRHEGVTFVTTLERARDLRPLIESLPEELRRSGQD